MAPSPLLKMNLYLSGKEIKYVPPKVEVQDTFNTVFEEIIQILSTVPRLFEKFGLPAGGLKKFYEAIVTDQDCNRLQKYIDDGNVYTYLLAMHIRSALYSAVASCGTITYGSATRNVDRVSLLNIAGTSSKI